MNFPDLFIDEQKNTAKFLWNTNDFPKTWKQTLPLLLPEA